MFNFSFKEWLVQTEARARFVGPVGYEEVPEYPPKDAISKPAWTLTL